MARNPGSIIGRTLTRKDRISKTTTRKVAIRVATTVVKAERETRVREAASRISIRTVRMTTRRAVRVAKREARKVAETNRTTIRS